MTNCHGLKMLAQDGKMRITDVADTGQLFRLIQSIPSHNSKNGNPNPSKRQRITEFIGTVLVCLNKILNEIEILKSPQKENFLYDDTW